MAPKTSLSILVRVLVVVVGGYAASAGFVAILSAVLAVAGMPRSEAVVLGSMMGFIIYALLLLWGFAVRRLWRFGAVLTLCVGSGLAVLIAW